MYFTILEKFQTKNPIYINREVNNRTELLEILSKNVIVSRPFSTDYNFICEEFKIDTIKKYIKNTGKEYITIIDLELKSKDELNKIIEIMRPFKNMLLQLKNFNYIDNYSCRLVLFSRGYIKSQIEKIKKYLCIYIRKFLPDIKIKSYRKNSFIFPCTKNIIFQNSVDTPLDIDVLSSFIPKHILYKFKPELKTHIFSVFNENGFIKERIENENKIIFSKKGKEYNWYFDNPFSLFEKNGNSSENFYNIIKKRIKLSKYKIYLDINSSLTRNPKNTYNFSKFNIINLKKSFLNKDKSFDDVNKKIEEFKNTENSVFSFSSCMGSGKSYVIQELCEQFKDKNILVLSPRVLLCKQLCRDLNFPIYSDVLDTNKLVCTFDSLYKVDIEKFDLIIIDEFVSFLEQVASGCNAGDLTFNMAKLNAIFTLSKYKIAVFDAFIVKNSLNVFNNKIIFEVKNVEKDNTPVILNRGIKNFFVNLERFVGKKISISCVSLKKMQELERRLSKSFTCALLDAELPTHIQEQILKDFNTGRINCLIYSPVISLGMNIMCNVDAHFHYDNGGTIAPAQSIQMIKRCRNAKIIFCYLGNHSRYNNDTYNDIINNLTQASKKYPIKLNFDKFGNLVLTDYARLYATIVHETNFWKSNFLESFKFLANINFSNILEITGKYTLPKIDDKLTKFEAERLVMKYGYRILDYALFGIKTNELNYFEVFYNLNERRYRELHNLAERIESEVDLKESEELDEIYERYKLYLEKKKANHEDYKIFGIIRKYIFSRGYEIDERFHGFYKYIKESKI